MDILQIKDLSFCYPGAQKNAVESVSFSVRTGEFVVVCGESGCGKTTLLRLLKPELAPAGELTGTVTFSGGERTPEEIGYVLQNPDSQIVTDKVWHELAFGLENLGLPTEVIRRRVGEMASYFGIQDWFRKKTDELSGGQKQLLNLAAVMVMQPRVLILDKPAGSDRRIRLYCDPAKAEPGAGADHSFGGAPAGGGLSDCRPGASDGQRQGTSLRRTR